MARVSKSQIDRLGERLRDAGEINDDDLGLLQHIRASHDDALAEVTHRLGGLVGPSGERLAPTTRLKTVQTIQDKLQREHIRLAQMQDIAGARVIVGASRVDQDAVVEAIVAAFPGARVSDRRQRPSFGYRAVHVIVRHRECHVEVQVRTTLQHGWAENLERLADLWGRQIRYGAQPNEANQRVRSLTRAEVLDLVRRLADAAAFIEETQASARAASQAGRAVDEEELDRGLEAVEGAHAIMAQLTSEFVDE